MLRHADQLDLRAKLIHKYLLATAHHHAASYILV
jgi:hypothetical protein